MTTPLEYLLAHYLGTRLRGGAPGVSFWPCPVCGSESFRTLPDKPGMKHRAKCRNPDCEFRGDAADMMRHFHPDENYGQHLTRMVLLEQQRSAKGLRLGSRRGARQESNHA
jgi:hypothetical protein